jgi:hypothetical protein
MRAVIRGHDAEDSLQGAQRKCMSNRCRDGSAIGASLPQILLKWKWNVAAPDRAIGRVHGPRRWTIAPALG